MDSAVERVRRFLNRFPYELEIIEFAESTHTAELAARAVGVEVGQIAKSVLFLVGETPVMVVTSGDVKVRAGKLKQAVGLSGKVRVADARTAEEMTGYPPGGVCPFAFPNPVRVLIDRSMARFSVVYAAAGSPHAAVGVTVPQLLDITGGELCDVC